MKAVFKQYVIVFIQGRHLKDISEDYYGKVNVHADRIALYLKIVKIILRRSLGMDKWFDPTLYNVCNYLSMLGLKLNGKIMILILKPC